MESINIKRSTHPYRSLMWLFVVSIPAGLFLYAMFSSHEADSTTFGIIAIIFLLPAIVDFIANKLIRLKTAIMISEQGLILSTSKGLYDSLAFLQIFQSKSKRQKLIPWQNITGLKLVVHYKHLTSYPNEGEARASTTYSEAQYKLCVENEIKSENIIFSVHNLNMNPDEILMHCNEYLRNHRDKMLDSISSAR